MPQHKEASQELQKLSALALEALRLSAIEARKVAIQTNTNLIVYRQGEGIVKIPPSQLKKELGIED